jgi:hypothetical protein
MVNFFERTLLLSGEEKKSRETACFKCKKVFPSEQLIGRRFHKYCKRCFWIDTAQMIAVAFIIVGAFVAAALIHK